MARHRPAPRWHHEESGRREVGSSPYGEAASGVTSNATYMARVRTDYSKEVHKSFCTVLEVQVKGILEGMNFWHQG